MTKKSYYDSRRVLLKGKGRLSTVFVLTSSDQLLYIENIIYVLDVNNILMRRSTVLSLPFLFVFPGDRNTHTGLTIDE
jgi:hypothetical protein